MSSLRTVDAEVANCTKTSRKLNNRNLTSKTLDERNKSLVKRSPGLARRMVNDAGQHVDAVDQVPEIEVIKENGSDIKRTENGKQTSIVVSDGNVVHDGNVMHAGTVGHAGNVMHAGTVGHAGNGMNNQAKRDKIAQIDALYKKQIEAEMMHEGLTYDDASNKSDATDIKNEYDYVKYTRVQVGNDTNIRVNSLAESGDHKMLDHITDDQCELEQNFLTEELQKVSKKNPQSDFSDLNLGVTDSDLDPETNDINSSETPPVNKNRLMNVSLMPSVEDGLSSGHSSDNEETGRAGVGRHKKYAPEVNNAKLHIDVKTIVSDCNRDADERNVSESVNSEKNRCDVEKAIQDIKSAIQKSKKVRLVSPSDEGNDMMQEPVWITRFLSYFIR